MRIHGVWYVSDFCVSAVFTFIKIFHSSERRCKNALQYSVVHSSQVLYPLRRPLLTAASRALCWPAGNRSHAGGRTSDHCGAFDVGGFELDAPACSVFRCLFLSEHCGAVNFDSLELGAPACSVARIFSGWLGFFSGITNFAYTHRVSCWACCATYQHMTKQ